MNGSVIPMGVGQLYNWTLASDVRDSILYWKLIFKDPLNGKINQKLKKLLAIVLWRKLWTLSRRPQKSSGAALFSKCSSLRNRFPKISRLNSKLKAKNLGIAKFS